ncbi:hypothetical protein ACIHDR_38770 [Nocardia sp. NPDC052278]|uniref:hypothetical protein n=1 Tax=unclassified Nocardia TaxID=2637762 RepID=UPI00369FC479
MAFDGVERGSRGESQSGPAGWSDLGVLDPFEGATLIRVAVRVYEGVKRAFECARHLEDVTCAPAPLLVPVGSGAAPTAERVATAEWESASRSVRSPHEILYTGCRM